jgi:hypothetical protein
VETTLEKTPEEPVREAEGFLPIIEMFFDKYLKMSH